MHNKNRPQITVHTAFVLLLTAFLPVIEVKAATTDILFIAYDQGESNAFIQIQPQLEQQNITYRILAFGRAAEIFREHPQRLDLKKYRLPENLRTDRDLSLPPELIKLITSDISASIIYSGMASRAQAQFLNQFKDKSRLRIAFYDNFDSLSSQDYTRSFIQELEDVTEFHVPSRLTAESFSDEKTSNIIITGQPTLTGWDDIFDNTNKAQLLENVGLKPQQTMVLFAGGYDGDYANSFRIFIQATRLMPDVMFLVTHHPKYSGDLEQGIINKEASNNVRLIKKGAFSTVELSTIASTVVVHKSTIAQQASYKGVPVVYVANDEFSNFVIEKGVAERVYSPEKLKSALEAIQSGESKDAKTVLGIPENPVINIIHRFDRVILQNHSSEKP